MIKFSEIKEAAKKKWKMPIETEGYFTVENDEGYRAYVELEKFGSEYENPNYYRGFRTATVHKPNRKTGTGREIVNIGAGDATIEKVIEWIGYTLERSQMDIESGKEKFDERKPHENGKYFI